MISEARAKKLTRFLSRSHYAMSTGQAPASSKDIRMVEWRMSNLKNTYQLCLPRYADYPSVEEFQNGRFNKTNSEDQETRTKDKNQK